jgi:rsbT co-antagonist protein RsbR
MKKQSWGIAVAATLLFAMVVLLPTFQTVLSCIRWEAWPASLIALHILGDAFIWLPYILIPLSVIKIRKEADLPMNEIFFLFAAFIVLCGFTHGMNIFTVVWPYYWAQGELKLVTAVVSMTTWVVLEYKIRPKLKELPKYQQILSTQAALEVMNAQLIAAQQAAEAKAAELITVNETLARQAEELRQAKEALEATNMELGAAKQAAETKAAELTTANAALAEQKAALEATNTELLQVKRALEEARHTAEQSRDKVRGERDELQGLLDKISSQELAIRELSAVVLEVEVGMLLAPVMGMLDSRRASQLMEVITAKVAEKRAFGVILDVAGVEVVDTAVADHLLKIEKVIKLMGSRCVITGIRPEVAQTIVQLGVTLPEVTSSKLADGIEIARRLRRAPTRT